MSSIPSTPQALDPSRTPEDDPDAGLHRGSLGGLSIMFMVVSAAAPLSVAAGIGPLAILIGGVGSPVVYLLSGVVLAVFAVGFMTMTRHVAVLGGFYTYISAALGRVAGLGSAFVALVSYNALQIGLYGLLGVQATGMLHTVFGVVVPWWVPALIGLVLVQVLGYVGIDIGAKVVGILLILETVVLLLLVGSVIFKGGHDGLSLSGFSTRNLFTPGMFAVLGFGFAAFIGFESSVLYREEARDPSRSVPRATYGAIAFMAIFYTVVLWAVIQAFGDTRVQAAAAANPAGLFFTAMRQYVGPWAENAMYLLITTSIFAGQLAFHNAINRYTFALARDGVLPRTLHRTHPRFGSPWPAGLAQSVLAAAVVVLFAVIGADPYLQLVLWVNSPGVFGIIGLQAVTAIAVCVYFVRRQPGTRVPRYVVPTAVFSAFAMTALWIVLVTSVDTLTAAGPIINTVLVLLAPFVFIVGAAVAIVLRRRRSPAFERIGGGGL